MAIHFLFFFFTLFSSFLSSISSSFSSSCPLLVDSVDKFENYTAISDMRVLNRRVLVDCLDFNPFLFINTSAKGPLIDEINITVTVGGVLEPHKSDWIAMITPSNAEISNCPLNGLLYAQTGDISCLPLLCHYPVKAQYVSSDPSYLNCDKKKCEIYKNDDCLVHSCSASVTFHVVNFRTDIEFVFFSGGFATPCILKRSDPISFANPRQPLYGHLSSIDSNATLMRLTWVSGDEHTQVVQYAQGKSSTSQVSTFTQDDMCSGILPSPAKDFGWHEPGYIHTAIMDGLLPNQTYYYRYGSDLAGWSEQIKFKTAPATGSNELKFLVYGDMGKAPLDPSMEHYIQPGSISVVKALTNEIASGNVDSIFHIGDISYATGFLVEWDFFLSSINPLASHVAYMTAIGNHERHRPMYSSSSSILPNVDSKFVESIEPLLMKNKVDLVFFGHVHNYERTCAVYQKTCKGLPTKVNGIDTYNNSNYAAPVHVTVGTGGFTLDKFSDDAAAWSLLRISEFGYARIHATREKLSVEFVNSNTSEVRDRFQIIKGGDMPSIP